MVEQTSVNFEGFSLRVCERGDWCYVPTMDIAAVLGMNQFTVRNIAKRSRGVVIATLAIISPSNNRCCETLCVRVDTLQLFLAAIRPAAPESQRMLELCQTSLVDVVLGRRVAAEPLPPPVPKGAAPTANDATLDELADRIGQILSERIKGMVGDALRRVGQCA